MLFYNGFIKEVKKLEDKYFELKILYKDGKSKNTFDLYDKNGEITKIEIKNTEECDFLKALIYSYMLRKYSDINELEGITNNFNVPNVLIINNVLGYLEKNNIDINLHLNKFDKEMVKDSEGSIALFLNDLYNYYIDNESITEEFLDMNIIQRGITEIEYYAELRRLLFKATALELISDCENFEGLDNTEKKLIKYSILFGSIDNIRCREIIGKDLREIASVYYDDNSVNEEKLMNIITSIPDIYNYFSNKFKGEKSKVNYSFTDAIESFEAFILAKDNEENIKMSKGSKKENIQKEEKVVKEEKAKLPNFSASRFELEEEVVDEKNTDTVDNPRLEILVDSIKTAKELKEDLEESVELHQVIEELIPAKEIIRKMKAKREQEIIEQIKKISEILKTVESEGDIKLDFMPLDEVIKILDDKGYKIKLTGEEVSLTW